MECFWPISALFHSSQSYLVRNGLKQKSKPRNETYPASHMSNTSQAAYSCLPYPQRPEGRAGKGNIIHLYEPESGHLLVCFFYIDIVSTFLNASYSAIKVGKLSQNPSQMVENIVTAIPSIAKAIPGGWDNVQSLHIKTNSSVSLPIWSCLLEVRETGGWHGIGNEGSATRADEKEEEDREEATNTAKGSKKLKSKKRSPVSDDEAEGEAPRKKAKPVESSAKRDKTKLPTTVKTLSPPRAIDPSRKKDQKTSKSTPEVDGKVKKKVISGIKDTPSSPAAVNAAKPTVTKEETKAKYTSTSFEKKKRLITKAKGGKSTKDVFLGRKVGQ